MLYIASADDFHIKYFHRRKSPATAGLRAKVELSSTWSMPGTDYDSLINVHIRRNGVPGHAGGYIIVMSAAYENQALQAHLP